MNEKNVEINPNIKQDIISNLPIEIAKHSFSFFSVKDLLRIGQVSKNYRRIINAIPDKDFAEYLSYFRIYSAEDEVIIDPGIYYNDLTKEEKDYVNSLNFQYFPPIHMWSSDSKKFFALYEKRSFGTKKSFRISLATKEIDNKCVMHITDNFIHILDPSNFDFYFRQEELNAIDVLKTFKRVSNIAAHHLLTKFKLGYATFEDMWEFSKNGILQEKENYEYPTPMDTISVKAENSSVLK